MTGARTASRGAERRSSASQALWGLDVAGRLAAWHSRRPGRPAGQPGPASAYSGDPARLRSSASVQKRSRRRTQGSVELGARRRRPGASTGGIASAPTLGGQAPGAPTGTTMGFPAAGLARASRWRHGPRRQRSQRLDRRQATVARHRGANPRRPCRRLPHERASGIRRRQAPRPGSPAASNAVAQGSTAAPRPRRHLRQRRRRWALAAHHEPRFRRRGRAAALEPCSKRLTTGG